MNRPRRCRPVLLALALFPLLFAGTSRAENPQESSSKRPPEEGEAPTKPAPGAKKAPDLPRYDPLRAEKDIEVGNFYLKKGNVDAAIDRYRDAIEYRPNYALPHKLLAQALEKKRLKKEAIRSYTRYLEIYPHAEDAEKIRQRIDQLRESPDKKPGKSS